MGSKIEWTDLTWQVTHGCAKVSPGCANCYAIRDVHRMAGNPNPVISDPRKGKTHRVGDTTDWTGVVGTAPQNLAWPLRKKVGKRIFVNSNSDLFHKDVPFEFIAAVFGVMAATPQHTYQILTKRPARMLEFFKWALKNDEIGYGVNAAITEMFGYEGPNQILTAGAPVHDEDDPSHISIRLIEYPPEWPLANVWLGVSVEDQEAADERIPLLLETPAALRFISYEPALGGVDVREWLGRRFECPECEYDHKEHGTGLKDKEIYCGMCAGDTGRDVRLRVTGRGLDWIIAGGESGPKARTLNLEWLRSMKEQCVAASVPCFIKQLGARSLWPDEDAAQAMREERPISFGGNGHGQYFAKLQNKKGGDPDEWPDDLQVRQFPERIGNGSH